MAGPTVDKAIVTNLAALGRKYGPALAKVRSAIDSLVKADLKRGLRTRLIGLDDAATMKAFGAAEVSATSKPRQYKEAVDAVVRKVRPDYVMILGAVDVVPHQDLANPTDDEDSSAWGDLPYACEARYSKKIRDFLAPTRVVGRLPDVTGSSDAGYLLGLLKTAAAYKPLSPAKYLDHLGISAAVWRKSTAQSLVAVFSSSKGLRVSPPKGPKWTAKVLGRASHFINCHGAPADPQFYGQSGQSYPIAHDALRLLGHVTKGTIVAAECCYGAQLYDPSADGVAMGICNTYLQEGAYGVFGSSTIAYGPEEGNDAADLICQYFLVHALAGASLGRAALQARQDFVKAASPLDPQNLKTLGQFSLLADPALVAATVAFPVAVTKTLGVTAKVPAESAPDRGIRRLRLAEMGLAIGAAAGAAAPSARKTPTDVRMALKAAAGDLATSKPRFSRYEVEFGDQPAALAAMAKALRPKRPVAFHQATYRLPENRQKRGLPEQRLVVVATQVGETLSIRRLFTR